MLKANGYTLVYMAEQGNAVTSDRPKDERKVRAGRLGGSKSAESRERNIRERYHNELVESGVIAGDEPQYEQPQYEQPQYEEPAQETSGGGNAIMLVVAGILGVLLSIAPSLKPAVREVEVERAEARPQEPARKSVPMCIEDL